MEIYNFNFTDIYWDSQIIMYNLRDKYIEKTETYSKEELLRAHDIIISELVRENIEQYNPDLVLMDSANRCERVMVVHAMIADETERYNGDESRNRTFYIVDGIMVKVEKGLPKSAGKYTTR